MSTLFKGLGCYTRLVEAWNVIFRATDGVTVYQEQTMSGDVHISIRNKLFEIELGQ